MDPQNYYEVDKGLYCVLFPNKQGLSIDEITDIFSEFGKVIGVRAAGDDYGYRFVRYSTEDEVLRCIEGLRNHQAIKLKIPNPKKNKNHIDKDASSSLPHEQKNQSSETLPTNKTSRKLETKSQPLVDSISTSGGGCSSAGEKKNSSRPTKAAKDLKAFGELSQPQASGFVPDAIGKPRRHPEVTAETFTPVDAKSSSVDSTKNCTRKVSNNSIGIGKILNTASTSVAAYNPNALLPQHLASMEIPRLVHAISTCGLEQNGGVSQTPGAATLAMPATKTAEEVVIANIHIDFGVNYILHLIEKYKPLCVSAMKIIPDVDLRYCIVYVQSLEQAQAIDNEFDHYLLSGKNLIVARTHRLVNIHTIA